MKKWISIPGCSLNIAEVAVLIATTALLAGTTLAMTDTASTNMEATLATIPIFAETAPPDFYTSGKGRILIVNPQNPAASDTNSGTLQAPFRSINAAAQQAEPGDEIRVMPGVYRERITPARGGTAEKPIRYVAVNTGAVIVKGSDLWTPAWHPVAGIENVYSAEVDPALFKGGHNPLLRRISIAPKDDHIPARPIKTGDAFWPWTLGQLYVSGQPYRQVENLALVHRFPETWIVNADGQSVTVHFGKGQTPDLRPPVELTVRDRIFSPHRRSLNFIQVKGFIFEHCANQGSFPQGGAVSTRSGHHWRIENNIIRHAQTVGLDCGSETWDPATFEDTLVEDRLPARRAAGFHLIAGNTITDNGLCGIEGWHTRNTRIIGNIIERNNCLDFDFSRAKWEEWAGIKLHDCHGTVIERNLVRNNEAYGIWLDNQWSGVRVTRNVVLNNRLAGIFCELGNGPVMIDNNIVAHSRPNGVYYDGIGIYAHDASGLTVAHNLILANAGCGVLMRTTSKRLVDGSPCRTSDERILNNIIVENGAAAINLPYPNALAERNVSDGNLLFGAREFWQGQLRWPGLMAVNQFISSVSRELIVQSLSNKLQHANIPQSEWPNLNTWSKNPVLTLPQWQVFTSNDCNSVESAKGFSCHLMPQLLQLDIRASNDLYRVVCEPIPGIERDFFGNAIPAKTPLPGPFQAVTMGTSTMLLWPAPESR